MQLLKNQQKQPRKRKNKEYSVEFSTVYDIDDVMSLMRHYFLESGYSRYQNDCEYCDETARQTFMEYLESPQTMCVMVKSGDNPAGFAVVGTKKTFYKKPDGDVVMFYVSPEHRATGASRILRDAVEECMDLFGCGPRFTECGSDLGDKNTALYANLWKKKNYRIIGLTLARIN